MRKIVIIFLFICLNICFGCSKETFQYPQHMFWLRNFKYATLSGDLYLILRTITHEIYVLITHCWDLIV